MLDAPFYLALGSCVIEDGSGDGPYHVTGMSFPEPAPDGHGGHLPAARTVALKVTGSTIAEVSTNLAVLRREAVRDEMLYFRPSSSGSVLECRVREATVVEDSYDPLRRSASANPKTTVTLTVTTDPYWLAPWADDVTPTVDTVPGHFDVADVLGEVDALLRVRAIFDNEGTAAFIGVKPEPGPDYEYLDDYGASGAGTSDANALGGYKLTHNPQDAWEALGTPPDIDTNDNRGRSVGIVRVDTDTAVSIRPKTTTTGAAIAVSSAVTGASKAISSASLIGYEIGNLDIPAGQVPRVSSGSGWSDEAVMEEQATDDGTLTLTPAGGALVVNQTFPGFSGKVTAVEFTIDAITAVSFANRGVAIVDTATSAEVPGTVVLEGPVTAGTHKVAFPSPVTLSSTKTYALQVYLSSASAFTVGFAYGNNRYADGALTTTIGSGESANHDLLFKVYGQEALGFNSSVGMEVFDTGNDGSAVAIDYLQRIPVDYAALVYRKGSSGSLALFYDGDTDTPYIADADGIGPAIYDKCEIRRPLRVRPGVTNRVVLGVLQADEAIDGATITYSYRPRYLSATG